MIEEAKAKQDKQLQWIKGIVSDAQRRNWYGTIRIEMKQGVITLVHIEETIKFRDDERDAK